MVITIRIAMILRAQKVLMERAYPVSEGGDRQKENQTRVIKPKYTTNISMEEKMQMKKMNKAMIVLIIALMAMVFLCSHLAASGQIDKPAAGEGYEFPYEGDYMEYTIGYTNGWKMPDESWDKAVGMEIKKRLGNVFLKHVDVEGGEDMQMKAATNTLPDVAILQTGYEYLDEFTDTGIFLELSQYSHLMPVLNEVAKEFPFVKQRVHPDGKFYGYSLTTIDTAIMFWNVPVLNGYYLKRGLEVPTTGDEYYEFLKGVKKINPDSFPMLHDWNERYKFQLMGKYGAHYFLTYDRYKKKWVYGPLEPEFKKGLEFAAKAFAEGLIPQDWLTMSGEEVKSLVWSPKGNMWGEVGMGWADAEKMIEQVQKTEPDFDLVAYLPVAAERGGLHKFGPYAGFPGNISPFAVVVRADVENPELLISVLNFLMDEEMATVINFGVEGLSFEYKNGAPVLMSHVKNKRNLEGTVNALEEYGLGNHPFTNQFSIAVGPIPSGEHWLGTQSLAMRDAMGPIPIKWNEEIFVPYFQSQPELWSDGTGNQSLTPEENERKAAIMAPVETYVKEGIVMFINGRRPISEIDQFIEEIKKMGDIQAVLQMYNSKPRPVQWTRAGEVEPRLPW